MGSATRHISNSDSLALKNQPPYILSLLILSILALIAYFGRDVLLVESGIFSSVVSGTGQESESQERNVPEVEKLPFALGDGEGSCDLFKGKWVWDNVSYPLYKEQECPFMDPQNTCLANGRPDRAYQFWRWQPHGCDIPRFNATVLMESIRDKRMLFAGDSLNRGQFYSMVCLVHATVPDSEGSIKQHDSFITFHAKNYNATIEFYWAPYLLESNSDSFYAHKISDGVVRKNSIDKHAENWKGVDIIIFDSYIWWLTGPNMKVLDGSFEDKPQHIVNQTTEEAYGMGINVMIKWVNENMDQEKTRVFFTTMSPFHHMSAEWGGRQWGNCANETTMITNETFWGAGCRKSMMQVIQDEFGKSNYPITLLNITQLSIYRKEAHIGFYKKRWSTWTPETTAIQLKYPDCMHYCLPGLQDTWNELLFAKLFYP